uniref:Glycosyltransferase family 92 protein n=1 Tax=Rhipicephalus appendiculatus TaxID=34631 RepID=A0A131YJ70_RHIAP
MARKQLLVAWKALRRVLLLAFVWIGVCYAVFHFTHGAGNSFLIGPFQRSLLQTAAPPEHHVPVEPVKSVPTSKLESSTASQRDTTPNGKALLNLRPHIDISPSVSMKEFLSKLSNMSNIPRAYWENGRKPPISSKSCVKFPELYDLAFNNLYWQKLSAKNGTFYIYGAYFDNRSRVGNVPLVRILVMADRVKPPPTLCQLWYNNGAYPTISTTKYTYAWYSKWGNYQDGILQPFIVTCKAPYLNPKREAPLSVSLVEKQCDKPTNNVRVVNNRPAVKQDFAVCVKGLDFLKDDLSVRLIEWIELLNILGAKKIFLYELEIHPNISKTLQYYQQKGLVELTPITLPGGQPNLPGLRHNFLSMKLTHKRQNELIPYNDCLYRNLYSYEYIVLLDIDEVVMPVQHHTWKELMNDVVPMALQQKNYTRASYNVRNVYFLDDMMNEDAKHTVHEVGIPGYMHMLQHVYRAKNFTKPGSYVKCFHNVERIVSVHNHFPLNCFGTCTTYSIDTPYAQLQHYRKDCVGPLKKSCNSDFKVYTVKDTTIWRYKDELIQRATKALKDLGFFS